MAKTAAYDDIVGNLQKRAWMYFLLAAIVFASVFYIAPDIIEWLSDRLLPEDATLIYLSPAEYLILKMRVAGYAAISATAMIAMIHIWRIIRSRSILPEISCTDLVLILVIALVLFPMGILYSLELTTANKTKPNSFKNTVRAACEKSVDLYKFVLVTSGVVTC